MSGSVKLLDGFVPHYTFWQGPETNVLGYRMDEKGQ
jgi:hypothetical protein